MAERNDALWIDYTNWRGERGVRQIRPCDLTWGSNTYHREPQWLLRAWDVERQAIREFAFRDIHRISPAPFPDGVALPDGSQR